MAELLVAVEVSVGTSVLHGDVLGLAGRVARHDMLLPHASCIAIKSNSIGLLIFSVLRQIGVIKILLVHVSRVRLLERSGDSSRLRGVPLRLRTYKRLRVGFPSRIRISIVSKVHLL